MNFKGNSFSIGEGQVVSAAADSGLCHIFISKNGVTGRIIFDPAKKTVKGSGAASYAESCFYADADGILELRDGRLSYEQR